MPAKDPIRGPRCEALWPMLAAVRLATRSAGNACSTDATSRPAAVCVRPAGPEPIREGVLADAVAAPAGRTGTPDDVAAVVALLIASSYVTGTVIPCDGGLRLR